VSLRQLRLPLPPHLERAPELAALSILDAALTASEAALLASHLELYNGVVDGLPRGASALRANAVIVLARRLAAALAAYRDALDREARRDERARYRVGF